MTSEQFKVRFYHSIFGGDELGSIAGHFGPVNVVAFSPDGRRFAPHLSLNLPHPFSASLPAQKTASFVYITSTRTTSIAPTRSPCGTPTPRRRREQKRTEQNKDHFRVRCHWAAERAETAPAGAFWAGTRSAGRAGARSGRSSLSWRLFSSATSWMSLERSMRKGRAAGCAHSDIVLVRHLRCGVVHGLSDRPFHHLHVLKLGSEGVHHLARLSQVQSCTVQWGRKRVKGALSTPSSDLAMAAIERDICWLALTVSMRERILTKVR